MLRNHFRFRIYIYIYFSFLLLLFLKERGTFPDREIRVFKTGGGSKKKVKNYCAKQCMYTEPSRIHRRGGGLHETAHSFPYKFISVISCGAQRQCSPLAAIFIFFFSTQYRGKK